MGRLEPCSRMPCPWGSQGHGSHPHLNWMSALELQARQSEPCTDHHQGHHHHPPPWTVRTELESKTWALRVSQDTFFFSCLSGQRARGHKKQKESGSRAKRIKKGKEQNWSREQTRAGQHSVSCAQCWLVEMGQGGEV